MRALQASIIFIGLLVSHALFPLKETWYSKYRNYEVDPIFGGTAKCLRFSQKLSPDKGAYYVVAQYSPDVSIDLRITLSSSPNYTTENIMKIQPQGQDFSLQAYIAYQDSSCELLRLPYAGEGACALIVPESKLRSNATWCDSIFDRICGSTPRFYVYDSSCSSS